MTKESTPHQLSLIDLDERAPLPLKMSDEWLAGYLNESKLSILECEFENWQIQGSSAELNTLTHGFFRYFGKFPPPVAKKFILEFHKPEFGPVIDPMVGSGTTLIEALILKRQAIGLDLNPLAALVSKVKTTTIPKQKIFEGLEKFNSFWALPITYNFEIYIPKDHYLNHWFFPETQRDIARVRFFIDNYLGGIDIKDFFLIALASIIRRVSRASIGLGRMFMDPKIKPQNIQEHFNKKIKQMEKGLEALSVMESTTNVVIQNALFPCLKKACTNFVIFHPPYFNLYKYSSIYKFEMLWLGFEYNAIKKFEVREGFKIGKKELVLDYVKDILNVLKNMSDVLVPGGWCVLMVGDTFLRGERLNVTSMILEELKRQGSDLVLRKIIVRHPKYTEASYAATQRRDKKSVGIKTPDHLVIFQKQL